MCSLLCLLTLFLLCFAPEASQVQLQLEKEGILPMTPLRPVTY